MFVVHHKKGIHDVVAQRGRKTVVQAHFVLLSCIKRGNKNYKVLKLSKLLVSFKGLKGRLETWKGALELKRLRVNVKKIKMMISSGNPGKFTVEGKFPCAVYIKGLGSNSILC